MTTSEQEKNIKRPKSKKKRWFNYITNGLLVAIILILLIPSWRSAFQTWFAQLTLNNVEFKAQSSEKIPEDQKNWELIAPDGMLYNFAEFEGKPVVIYFWATWCTYCKASFPDLGDLRDNFKNEIVFIGVTTESLDVLTNSGYTDKYDFLYCTQAYPPFFNVKMYPTLVIMDKEMNKVYTMEGAGDINSEDNIAFLKRLL